MFFHQHINSFFFFLRLLFFPFSPSFMEFRHGHSCIPAFFPLGVLPRQPYQPLLTPRLGVKYAALKIFIHFIQTTELKKKKEKKELRSSSFLVPRALF